MMGMMMATDENVRQFYRDLYAIREATPRMSIGAVSDVSTAKAAKKVYQNGVDISVDALGKLRQVAGKLKDTSLQRTCDSAAQKLRMGKIRDAADTCDAIRAYWNKKYSNTKNLVVGDWLSDLGAGFGGVLQAGSNIVNGTLAIPGDIAKWVGGGAAAVTTAVTGVASGVSNLAQGLGNVPSSVGGGMNVLLIGGLAIAAIFLLKD